MLCSHAHASILTAVAEWLEQEYPKLGAIEKPLECTQRSGDIMFVPGWWGHGTYTMRDSVGVAVELVTDHGLFPLRQQDAPVRFVANARAAATMR